MNLAKESGCSLQAEFVPNDRNRMMHITYRFAGFEEIEKKGNHVILQHDLNNIPSFPDYMNVNVQ